MLPDEYIYSLFRDLYRVSRLFCIRFNCSESHRKTPPLLPPAPHDPRPPPAPQELGRLHYLPVNRPNTSGKPINPASTKEGFVDPFLIPLQLLIVILFIFRIPLARKILKKDDLTPFLSDVKVRIGLWWKTVLLPVAVIVVFYLAWARFNVFFFHNAPTPAAYESVPVLIVESLILAPVSEQIIQCIFLSFIYVASTRVTTNRWKIGLINGIMLAGVSLLLVIGHANFNPVSLLLRFFLFMMYGGIYYLNDRDLFPAIIAHSAWNLLAVLTFPF